MKHLLFILFSLITTSALQAYSDREINALRISQPIKIDGILNESVWSQAQIAEGFTQTEPVPGAGSSHDTRAYILYDNDALYIGAFMKDNEPDKILKELSLRDQIGNADNFRFFVDPYKSGLNGFKFYVTASGVQYEAIVSNHIDDPNWNCVWESEVKISDKGWYVEMRIPYSSLRFPDTDVQSWGMQIGREIRRLREVSYWSPIDPNINGWVQQSGIVNGLTDIKTPVRLSLTPYVSTYLNATTDKTNNKTTTTPAYSAGLDLKYGINDAFTLDMTLIPDFGQVISDKQVLNLSPFEVFFEENRQFFTEGTELFNKGNLFYSRRIGDRPLHYFSTNNSSSEGDVLINNPSTTQLYNASKISGRSAGGIGAGFFNAIVGESYATFKNINTGIESKKLTNPLTNYNSLVLDKNLKNNSYISIINNNVMRRGKDIDANVTGVFTSLRTKNQNFGLTANAVMSNRFGKEETTSGYTYNVETGKISGKWTYGLAHGLESDNYNPNDLGFLYSPNEIYYSMYGAYTSYKPKNIRTQQVKHSASINYGQLYSPNVYTGVSINARTFVMYKTRFAYGADIALNPLVSNNYFEPRWRDFRQYLAIPDNYAIGGFVSSDYRKPVAYDIRANYRLFNTANRNTFTLTLSPRFRFSDQVSLILSSVMTYFNGDQGFVGYLSSTNTENKVIIGTRKRNVIENTFTTKYTFNSKMNINMRVRHYWDKVIYNAYGSLNDDGSLTSLPLETGTINDKSIHDRNINIFNIDLQYNWRFAPGSDIIVVWKNQVFGNDQNFDRDYFDNLGGIWDSNQDNNLSLRIIYFLDYQNVVKA